MIVCSPQRSWHRHRNIGLRKGQIKQPLQPFKAYDLQCIIQYPNIVKYVNVLHYLFICLYVCVLYTSVFAQGNTYGIHTYIHAWAHPGSETLRTPTQVHTLPPTPSRPLAPSSRRAVPKRPEALRDWCLWWIWEQKVKHELSHFLESSRTLAPSVCRIRNPRVKLSRDGALGLLRLFNMSSSGYSTLRLLPFSISLLQLVQHILSTCAENHIIVL